MASGREEYAYLQVERPVISGADSFLAKAEHLGKSVLGEVYRTAITQLTVEETGLSDIEPSYRHIPVPESQLRVEKPEELRLILLHRRALAEVSSRYKFSYHAGQLGSQKRPVYPSHIPPHSTRFKQTDLYTQLDQVSRDCGVDPDRLVVMFDRIDIVHEDGVDGVVALYPKQGEKAQQVIQAQIKVAEERLSQQSERLAELQKSSTTGAIRIAAISNNVKESKAQLLLDELKELLPLRLVLGGVSAARSKEARHKS